MHLLREILEQSRRQGGAPALAEGERRLDFAAVARGMEMAADVLGHAGVGTGDRVAVCLDRGIDAALAIFGILRRGACYVPLDISNPPARLARIVDDADVAVVTGKGPIPPWLKGRPWLDCTAFTGTDPPPGPLGGGGEGLAAILYTSGSTGQPKGVALSHRAMKAFSDWAACRFSLGPEDRVASLAPFHFDLSVFDLFAALGRGACVDFVPAGLTLAPSRLAAWLREHRISALYTVPSLLSFLAFKGNLAANPLSDLRLLLFAGEVFPTPALIGLASLLPGTEFYNLYGPTETNVCCYWPVERRRLSPRRPIPIGSAACGAELRVDQGSGELLVKGPALLSGYWRQGGLQHAMDGDGWYHTGDRVSLSPAGELLYHGRFDRMLKCSGHRVEPGEIEASMLALPGVRECAVVGLVDSAGGQRPAVAWAGEAMKAETVIHHLRENLPRYMVPVRCQPLQQLPRLSNGKIDYETIVQLLGE